MPFTSRRGRRRAAALRMAHTAAAAVALTLCAAALATRGAHAATSVVIEVNGINNGAWWDGGYRAARCRRAASGQHQAAQPGDGHHRFGHAPANVRLTAPPPFPCADVTAVNTTTTGWLNDPSNFYNDPFWWNEISYAQVRLGRRGGGLGAEVRLPCSRACGMVAGATAGSVPLLELDELDSYNCKVQARLHCL